MNFKAPDTIALLDGLHEPLLLLDEDRTVLFMNRPARLSFSETHIGHNFVRLIRHPDVIQLLGEVGKENPSASVKAALDHPVARVYEFRATHLAGSSESNPMIAVALHDLSELETAEQMRSDFVANVSHELRSPLTTLAGFIETIKGPAQEDPVARERFLDLMEREAARMVRLIADLLSLSKVENDRKPRTAGTVDVADLVARAVTNLSARAKAENRSISLKTEGGKHLVAGSEDELMQVMINLIENGIKYSKSESEVRVCVSTGNEVAGLAGEAVTVVVEDEGEGIPREHIPRLTERFYRVDTHRSRDKGGTGLGLAIVKHIIQQHRGRLQISSTVGSGSRFTVHLPAKHTSVDPL